MATNDGFAKRQISAGQKGGHTRAVDTIRGHEIIVLKSPPPSQIIEKEIAELAKAGGEARQKKLERRQRRLEKRQNGRMSQSSTIFF